ncbi:MAG TPA: N-acetyl-gamma-glutamyl-phosphate reductase [Chitinispirillaceae bacterium]|nr:N-acetyl-gamma-glutamyl-phosphate reductase [Chitinispirillaceae bacterium]
MFKLFIDGQEGTTGLQIRDRIKYRDDIELLEIPYEKRKDPHLKSQYLNSADMVILCLPDSAARESVSMIRNNHTRIIDASTAFRTAPDWVYGIPELDKNQRKTIRNSSRVSNPGCYATGFIMLLKPLIANGIVPSDYPVSIYAVSGYSGGGKKLIAAYEDEKSSFKEPRYYALSLSHKHIPEMTKHSGLSNPPLFVPIVGNYYKGMVVSVPLHQNLLSKKFSDHDIRSLYMEYYDSEPFVKVMDGNPEQILNNGFLSPVECNDTNMIELFVFAKNEQLLIMTRFDNLGKGASGAAVQNMNIMMDVEESKGLI